jgi:hypothetical protein
MNKTLSIFIFSTLFFVNFIGASSDPKLYKPRRKITRGAQKETKEYNGSYNKRKQYSKLSIAAKKLSDIIRESTNKKEHDVLETNEGKLYTHATDLYYKCEDENKNECKTLYANIDEPHKKYQNTPKESLTTEELQQTEEFKLFMNALNQYHECENKCAKLFDEDIKNALKTLQNTHEYTEYFPMIKSNFYHYTVAETLREIGRINYYYSHRSYDSQTKNEQLRNNEIQKAIKKLETPSNDDKASDWFLEWSTDTSEDRKQAGITVRKLIEEVETSYKWDKYEDSNDIEKELQKIIKEIRTPKTQNR